MEKWLSKLEHSPAILRFVLTTLAPLGTSSSVAAETRRPLSPSRLMPCGPTVWGAMATVARFTHHRCPD